MTETSRQASVELQLSVRQFVAGSFSASIAGQMASILREVVFPAGKTLYREGEAVEHLYLLLDGRVELTTADEDPWVMTPGAGFGILDAELGRRYSRDARAITDARTLVARIEDWLDLFEDNAELIPKRIEMLAAGVRDYGRRVDPPGGFPPPEIIPPRASSMPLSADGDARELNPFERLVALRDCPMLERAPTQALIQLARVATPRIFRVGETLVSEGQSQEALFVVVSGTLIARGGEPEVHAAFGPSDLAGGYLGLGQGGWPVTLEAATDGCLLAINYVDLYDVVEDHFQAGRSILAYLAGERVRLQRVKAPTG